MLPPQVALLVWTRVSRYKRHPDRKQVYQSSYMKQSVPRHWHDVPLLAYQIYQELPTPQPAGRKR